MIQPMGESEFHKHLSLEIIRDELVIISFEQCQFTISVAAMDAIHDAYTEYKLKRMTENNGYSNGSSNGN